MSPEQRKPQHPYPNEDPFFGLGDFVGDVAETIEAEAAAGLDHLGDLVGIADTRTAPHQREEDRQRDE
ncbi:MAG: hypothetical protein AAF679_11790 [Pseudomonadota bacterium]